MEKKQTGTVEVWHVKYGTPPKNASKKKWDGGQRTWLQYLQAKLADEEPRGEEEGPPV
mgnify:CR=1 FL=1